MFDKGEIRGEREMTESGNREGHDQRQYSEPGQDEHQKHRIQRDSNPVEKTQAAESDGTEDGEGDANHESGRRKPHPPETWCGAGKRGGEEARIQKLSLSAFDRG